MKKLVLALLLILLQLCTACSETTYHSNEEIGRAFQRHKSTFENVAVSAVGENSGYIHKPDAEGQETECGDSAASLWKLTGFTSICSAKCRIRSCGISLKRRLR